MIDDLNTKVVDTPQKVWDDESYARKERDEMKNTLQNITSKKDNVNVVINKYNVIYNTFKNEISDGINNVE